MHAGVGGWDNGIMGWLGRNKVGGEGICALLGIGAEREKTCVLCYRARDKTGDRESSKRGVLPTSAYLCWEEQPLCQQEVSCWCWGLEQIKRLWEEDKKKMLYEIHRRWGAGIVTTGFLLQSSQLDCRI